MKSIYEHLNKSKMMKDKRGGYLELFLIIVLAFVILAVSGVMIFIGDQTEDLLHDKMDDMDIGGDDQNVSEIIDNTMGKTNQSYGHLSWITVMLIFAMVFGVFFGAYKVRTQPIYFIPYLILLLIAVIVSVGVANSYEEIIGVSELSASFSEVGGGNYFMLHLPMFIGIIGAVGGIIMFISWATAEDDLLYGGGFGYG